ncbi:MAG: FMN-binding protein, partial [Ilumatobacteraceae bacterium]|nr:FMN-binding protein [Ilumatobacteraceae bacterium]
MSWCDAAARPPAVHSRRPGETHSALSPAWLTEGMSDEHPDPLPTAAELALAARLEQLAQRRAAPTAAGSNRSTTGGPHRTRRHPAARARAAAIGLSLASTAGLTAFFTGIGSSGANQLARANVIGSPAAASTPSTTAPGVQPTTSAPVRANAVVDGGAFQNRWGEVQVEATFAPDGTLVSVTALRTPNDRDKSIRINDVAVPRLNAEAVSAQSATVDTVS